MEYYILVDTLERESEVEVYKTEGEARNAMESRYMRYRDGVGRDEGDRCELHRSFAWINDLYGYDLDLSIHTVSIG